MTEGKEFRDGRGYTRQDWDEVSDNPEWTEEDFRNAKPFAEMFPDLAESIERDRDRPLSDQPMTELTLRLDDDIVRHFQATGPGWQSRINDALGKIIRKAG